jgi:hypothetical protein
MAGPGQRCREGAQVARYIAIGRPHAPDAERDGGDDGEREHVGP